MQKVCVNTRLNKSLEKITCGEVGIQYRLREPWAKIIGALGEYSGASIIYPCLAVIFSLELTWVQCCILARDMLALNFTELVRLFLFLFLWWMLILGVKNVNRFFVCWWGFCGVCFLKDVLLSWFIRVPVFFWSLLLYPIPEKLVFQYQKKSTRFHIITSCY